MARVTPGKNHQKRIPGIGFGPRKILFVFGTRPEALKVAILIRKMRRDPRFQPVVCVTGQHREMLDQVLDFFQIRPDYDLRVMRGDQSLCYVASTILRRLDEVIRSEKPAMVIVQGDTTSTLAGGLAAFYHQVVVGHVEAGLRTNVKYQPFPEEINRKLLSQLAGTHFAPTKEARENLIKEGVPTRQIVVTGN